ncbi:MAG: TolB family protein [Acidimicrobiia bacterium]
MKRLVSLALVVTAGLLGLEAASHPLEAGWRGQSGRIAFVTRLGDPAVQQVYTMNPDGSDVRQLTMSEGTNSTPFWSPDGSRIAFAREVDGDFEIYVMNADGSGQTPITDNSADDFSPTWSPDGTRIVFATNRDGSAQHIYVMGADGSNPQPLTESTSNDYDPVWSPLGNQIAFTRAVVAPFGFEIFVMDANGENETSVTDLDDGPASEPDWKPDGSLLAFAGARDPDVPGGADVWTIRPDGSDQQRVTNQNCGVQPAWAPDAARITYACFEGTDSRVWVIGANGTDPTSITTGPSDQEPNWQPILAPPPPPSPPVLAPLLAQPTFTG